MSHYTLASGQATTTVSLRCPQCRQRRKLSDESWRSIQISARADPRLLYCSQECRDKHVRALIMDVSQFCPIFAFESFRELEMLLNGYVPDNIARQLVNMIHASHPPGETG